MEMFHWECLQHEKIKNKNKKRLKKEEEERRTMVTENDDNSCVTKTAYRLQSVEAHLE